MTDEQILEKLLNADKVPEQTLVVKRLGIPVTIRALTSKQMVRIREQCTYTVRERGETREVLNNEKFNLRVVAAAMVKPDWNAPALREKYEASSVEEVLQRVLLAGELSMIGDAILALSGYDNGIDELKN